MDKDELNNNFSDNESDASLFDEYNELLECYNTTKKELQAYKIAEAYDIRVEDAVELLTKGSVDEVCDALDIAEARLDANKEDEKDYNDNESIEELIKQNELLLKENKYLNEQVKKLEISEPQKLKKSLENKIFELEKKLKQQEPKQLLEENYQDETEQEENYKDKYNSLKKTSDKIKDIKISELDHKICSDKKYQQLIMNLILHNSTASKLLIKHLNMQDSAREIIIDARSQISDLQQQMQELEDYSIQLNNNIENIKKSSAYFYDSSKKVFNRSKYYEEILPNKINEIYDEQAQNININQIKDSNFIIANDDKIIEALNLEDYGIPFCRATIEPFWHSVGDWFGYYNSESKFIPSKTKISDYYKFVRDTLDLPMGIVILDNFNQIPPEVYIEPFIKNIETINSYPLINPALVNEDNEIIQIEKLHNLKYILIKSSNDTCFDIPKSLEKYELGV